MSQSESSDRTSTPAQIDEQLQQEIDQALGGQSMEQIMEQAQQADAPQAAQAEGGQAGGDAAGSAAPPSAEAKKPIHHDMRRGRISAIRGDDVFVDIAGEAAKLQGVVPLTQFERAPRLGSIMDFVVDHVDEGQGLMFLSREGAISRSTWEQLQRGAVVEARVIATNKGGLELEMIGGIGAFMPASQIDTHHVDDLESLVGQRLEGTVQEIDRKSKKVVISRRQWLEQRKAQAKAKLMAELEVGQIRQGKVSSVVDFGAFVDLGGVDGLVHVSDMSYSHVDKPREVLKVGQDVTVKVLKIDTEKERISLGLKQVQPDPWESVGNRVKPGDQVTGKIVRTASFGAFVEIEAGIEGLLPISEMSWKRIHKAEEVVKQGDTLRMAVLSVEPGKRRISLSLKQAQGDPWIGAERKYAAQSVVDGKVIGTTDFGAFVELETGVEGLVHISELADRRVGQVEDVLKVGDENKFRVLEISEEDRKVRLSLKAAEKSDEQLQAEQQASAAPVKSKAKKQPPKNLKGGMDVGGVGLGGLRLDDLK